MFCLYYTAFIFFSFFFQRTSYSEVKLDVFLKSTISLPANRTGELLCKACNKLGCTNDTAPFLVTGELDSILWYLIQLLVVPLIFIKCQTRSYQNYQHGQYCTCFVFLTGLLTNLSSHCYPQNTDIFKQMCVMKD